ncbi:hypothetical protein WJX72_002538 [[Myrmecia] bisecta]|uniref:Uncharacterized protein n=1 Tax=[Myrmecia] bisecta TaxID=41462 RepID=A0AAW1PTS8_9CHLO
MRQSLPHTPDSHLNLWRQALAGLDSVAGISGWLHSPTEQSEADLVDRISVDVLNKLNPRARELPSIRVGVEAAVRDLVASAHLQQDQQVRVLGLADEGIALLRHRLGGHKVLLVLDDVAQQSGPDIPDMAFVAVKQRADGFVTKGEWRAAQLGGASCNILSEDLGSLPDKLPASLQELDLD